MSLKWLANSAVRTAVLGASLALSGCGLDDIQLNGKLFDAMGVNNTGSVKKEATLKERSPLVVPPGLDKLPEPGSEGPTEAAGIAEVKDYDQSRKTSKAELEKQQAAYCKVHYEDAKASGDGNADLAQGPLGPCRASVFTAIQKWNKSGDDDGDAEAQ